MDCEYLPQFPRRPQTCPATYFLSPRDCYHWTATISCHQSRSPSPRRSCYPHPAVLQNRNPYLCVILARARCPSNSCAGRWHLISGQIYAMALLTTKLNGTFGNDVADEDGGEGNLSSFARMAICSCSYLGPLKYRSILIVTVGPVFLKSSTAWWFV